MARRNSLFNFNTPEQAFCFYCELLKGNHNTLEYVANQVAEEGYDKDDFLRYYYTHENKIDEYRREWRKIRWKNVLRKISEPLNEVLSFNLDELWYCMRYFNHNEIDEIMAEVTSDWKYSINLIDEKTEDRRRIAKALVEDKIRDLLKRAHSWIRENHVSYIEDITTMFYDYPFLQEEQELLFNYLEKNGVIIDGKPPLSALPKQTRAKYFTEEERLEARKSSQDKYRKKNNKPNMYNIENTMKHVNVGRFENWDFDQELDLSKYRKKENTEE